MSDFQTEPKSVEEKWIELLMEEGIPKDTAENIVSGIQAHPRLRARTPTTEEIRDHVGRAIQEHGFDDYDPIDNDQKLVDSMLETLEEGLQNIRSGPISKREGHDTSSVNASDDLSSVDQSQAKHSFVSGTGGAFGAVPGSSDEPTSRLETAGPDTSRHKQEDTSSIESLIAQSIIFGAEDAIQDDLGDVNIDDVRDVLINIAISSASQYKKWSKIAIFPSHGQSERDILYESLVEQRIHDLLNNDGENNE